MTTTRTPWEDYPDHERLRLQVTGPHERILWDVKAHPFIVRWSIPSNAHRLTSCVTRIREFATLEEAIAAFRRPFEEHRIPRPWQIGEIVGRARISVSGDTAWWVERTLSDAGVVEDGVFETDYANVDLLAGWVLRQNGRAIPLEPDELTRVRQPGARGTVGVTLRRRAGQCGTEAHRSTTAAARASDGPRRARAVRRSSGTARASPDGVRGRTLRHPRRGGGRRPFLDPARGAAGPPLAPQPRQLRRRLLRGLRRARRRRRARREGAVRRRLSAAPEAHAARGAGDPARHRVRRTHNRSGCAHAAQACAQEARGDVRALRSRRHAGSERCVCRGITRQGAERWSREAARRRDRVHEGGRRHAEPPPGRAVHDRA